MSRSILGLHVTEVNPVPHTLRPYHISYFQRTLATKGVLARRAEVCRTFIV